MAKGFERAGTAWRLDPLRGQEGTGRVWETRHLTLPPLAGWGAHSEPCLISWESLMEAKVKTPLSHLLLYVGGRLLWRARGSPSGSWLRVQELIFQIGPSCQFYPLHPAIG